MVPAPYAVAPDDTTEGVLSLIEGACPGAFGELRPFSYAVTAEDAERVLAHFIETRLANFGTYQDAMAEGDPWLFHSHIALYLNIGLLDPRACCEAAEAAYHDGKAPQMRWRALFGRSLAGGNSCAASTGTSCQAMTP